MEHNENTPTYSTSGDKDGGDGNGEDTIDGPLLSVDLECIMQTVDKAVVIRARRYTTVGKMPRGVWVLNDSGVTMP
jgi:hypothetical protein